MGEWSEIKKFILLTLLKSLFFSIYSILTRVRGLVSKIVLARVETWKYSLYQNKVKTYFLELDQCILLRALFKKFLYLLTRLHNHWGYMLQCNVVVTKGPVLVDLYNGSVHLGNINQWSPTSTLILPRHKRSKGYHFFIHTLGLKSHPSPPIMHLKGIR